MAASNCQNCAGCATANRGKSPARPKHVTATLVKGKAFICIQTEREVETLMHPSKSSIGFWIAASQEALHPVERRVSRAIVTAPVIRCDMSELAASSQPLAEVLEETEENQL